MGTLNLNKTQLPTSRFPDPAMLMFVTTADSIYVSISVVVERTFADH